MRSPCRSLVDLGRALVLCCDLDRVDLRYHGVGDGCSARGSMEQLLYSSLPDHVS